MPFSYDFGFAGNRSFAHNLSLGPVEDLSISVYEHADGGPVRIDFDGNPELYTNADLAQFEQRFLRILAAAADPGRAIGGLEILSGAERTQLLAGWNATARPVAAQSLPELFAAQALRTPAAVALVCGERRLSYAALCSHANRLAHHLRGLGVGPETVVGLCVERSPEMVIGLLGILSAGGAYLPLDPHYPAERLAFMLSDAGAPVLLGEARLLDRLPSGRAQLVRLDADWPQIARQPEQRARARPRPPAPGLRHLHLRLNRNPQRRRRRAPKSRQQDRVFGRRI